VKHIADRCYVPTLRYPSNLAVLELPHPHEVYEPRLKDHRGGFLKQLRQLLVAVDLAIESCQDGGDTSLLRRRWNGHFDCVKIMSVNPGYT